MIERDTAHKKKIEMQRIRYGHVFIQKHMQYTIANGKEKGVLIMPKLAFMNVQAFVVTVIVLGTGTENNTENLKIFLLRIQKCITNGYLGLHDIVA